MRTALVFGGSGQIGVPVIDLLRGAGWQVVAVSREIRAQGDRLRWLRGDLRHVEGLPAAFDAIFSLGPLDHFSRWYEGTSVTAPRVVAFGSTSIDTKYGSDDPDERDIATRLRNAEALVFDIAERRQAAATILRPTLVYGAGRDKTLTQIARMASRSGFFVLPRTARGLRQPVHVLDLAQAALAVIDADRTFGRSYALPGGETLGYAEMVERMLASLRPPARLLRLPMPLFKTVVSAAHAVGRLQGLGDAALSRMSEDLVFDASPAMHDFDYAPRVFQPGAGRFEQPA